MNPLGNPLTPPPTPRFWGSMGAGARLVSAGDYGGRVTGRGGRVGGGFCVGVGVCWVLEVCCDMVSFSLSFEQSRLDEVPSMLRPLVLASSRHRHTESYSRDMLMRHRTFNIRVSSTSGLLVVGAPPNLHICANTSANRSGRSLLDTDTSRIAQMVRLKRFLV